jgi:hypothetical protein
MNLISFLKHWQPKSSAIATALKPFRPKSTFSGVMLIATVGLTACSASGLSMNKVKETITIEVKEEKGIEIEALDCPEERELKAGDEFPCTAIVEDGRIVTVTVTQTDDQGNITWELVDTTAIDEAGEEPIVADNDSDDADDSSDSDDSNPDATIADTPVAPPSQTTSNDGNALNTALLASAITTGITQQTGIGVESVDCPDRPVLAGDEFDCIAYGQEDSTMTVRVIQKDDAGNVNWEIASSTRILDLSVMEQQIVEQLTEQTGVSGVVDCGGDRYKVAGAGDSFECTGTDNNGNDGIIMITVQDDSGNYRWEIN